MIAGRVLAAVGKAVDWSLIHVLAAISDRVEGRGADCYRRADALADMEADRDSWEAGELVGPESPKWLQDLIATNEGYAAETYKHFLPEPASHGFCGECPDDGPTCGEHTGRASNRCLLNAGHFGAHDDDPPTRDCQDRSAAVSTPAADNTTVDHLVALWDYHESVVHAEMDRDTKRFIGARWSCEGCAWTGDTQRQHLMHRLGLIADMTAATHRIQEQLGGAS